VRVLQHLHAALAAAQKQNKAKITTPQQNAMDESPLTALHAPAQVHAGMAII
jgi:hypothetical protein